jgi:hypothetical protein
VEVSSRVFGRKDAYVVSDVEIDGIIPGCFQRHVFSIAAKGLEGCCKCHWNLSLIRPQKHFNLEWPALQQANILGLNILKIYENNIRSHRASLR